MIDYSGLTPMDLFYTQKEAYLKKDMEAVKEMAKIAKSRIKFPNAEDWKKAKGLLKNTNFPNIDDPDWTKIGANESHSPKKKIHNLDTYKKWFDILGYEGEAKYNSCQECKKTMNAVIRIYNNQENTMSEKWFVYHGKDVEGKDILEMARRIFSVFVLLFII